MGDQNLDSQSKSCQSRHWHSFWMTSDLAGRLALLFSWFYFYFFFPAAKVFAWLLGVYRSVKIDIFQQRSLPDLCKVQQRISFNRNLQPRAFIDGCKQREKIWCVLEGFCFYFFIGFIHWFIFFWKGRRVQQRSSVADTFTATSCSKNKRYLGCTDPNQTWHCLLLTPVLSNMHTLQHSESLSHDRNKKIRFLAKYLLIL